MGAGRFYMHEGISGDPACAKPHTTNSCIEFHLITHRERNTLGLRQSILVTYRIERIGARAIKGYTHYNASRCRAAVPPGNDASAPASFHRIDRKSRANRHASDGR